KGYRNSALDRFVFAIVSRNRPRLLASTNKNWLPRHVGSQFFLMVGFGVIGGARISSLVSLPHSSLRDVSLMLFASRFRLSSPQPSSPPSWLALSWPPSWLHPSLQVFLRLF